MIRRVAFAVLLLGAFSGGCRTSTTGRVVADSTMINLLVELHLANGRIEVTDRPLQFRRDSILRVYGVDSSAYASTIAYFAEHPEEYSDVYGRVLDRLSAERVPVGIGDSARVSDEAVNGAVDRSVIPDGEARDGERVDTATGRDPAPID